MYETESHGAAERCSWRGSIRLPASVLVDQFITLPIIMNGPQNPDGSSHNVYGFQLFNTFTTRRNNTIELSRTDQTPALNPVLADLDSNDAENQKIFCSPSRKINISERVRINVSPEQVSSYLKSIQVAEVRMSSRIFGTKPETSADFDSTQCNLAGTLGLTVPLKETTNTHGEQKPSGRPINSE